MRWLFIKRALAPCPLFSMVNTIELDKLNEIIEATNKSLAFG